MEIFKAEMEQALRDLESRNIKKSTTSLLIEKVKNKQNNLAIIKLMLTDFEGYRNEVYKDSLGYNTVGIGHKTNLPIGTTINNNDIQNLFVEDIEKAKQLALSIYPNYDEHGDNIRIFMVIQAFNMGGNLRTFKNSNKHIINKEYTKAYNGFKSSLWCKQVKENRCKIVSELLLNKYNGYNK